MHAYVGDALIVTWTLDKKIKNGACVRCFFAIEDAMAHIVFLRLGVGPDVLGRTPALEQDGADRKKSPALRPGSRR